MEKLKEIILHIRRIEQEVEERHKEEREEYLRNLIFVECPEEIKNLKPKKEGPWEEDH